MKNGKECSRIFLRVVVAAVVVFGAIGIVPWQLVAQEASQPAKADLPSIGDLGGAKKPARARADIQWVKVQEANLDANVNVRTASGICRSGREMANGKTSNCSSELSSQRLTHRHGKTPSRGLFTTRRN